MNSPIEEIKSRIDLVDLIQGYVKLQKAGINYRANCPFHSEKTPSFFVSPTRQIWHCFGSCGEGGDMFKFIMKVEGCDFPEALKLLASRAGVVLKKEDPQVRSERNLLYEICEEATKLFEKNLSLTPAALAYLKDRGVSEDTIKEFRLGFAPKSWDFLIKAVMARGYNVYDLEKAGLALKSEDGSSWYDRFRGRIMFPVSDANGRVIGFGGRVFESEPRNPKLETASVEAKYINTPNTLLYDKSRVLYGFDKAKNEIRLKNHVIVVEGYMDCIMSQQTGVKNTIAVSGTALTPHQLRILKRLADNAFFSFDTDEAGESATRRSLSLASEFDFERRVVEIPSGKDPADVVKQDADIWRGAVANSKSVVEFYFNKAFRRYDSKTPQGKKEIASRVLPFIAELRDEIEKAHWVQQLSAGLGVSEDAVRRELNRRKSALAGSRREESEAFPVKTAPLRKELLEERFLILLLLAAEDFKKELLYEHQLTFTSDLNNRVFGVLQTNGAVADDSLNEHIRLLKFKAEVLKEVSDSVQDELVVAKKELEKECLRERLNKLSREIENLEKGGNRMAAANLLTDFRELSNKLRLLF